MAGRGFSQRYLLTLTDSTDERPVILYDQLDSGNSDRPCDSANWTVERFVDEVDHVRNALGPDSLVVLGGSGRSRFGRPTRAGDHDG